MASPKIVVFALFSASSGSPLPGQTPGFLTYKDEAGTDITMPTISEVGGGLYKFTPNFTTNHGAGFMIDAGASSSQRYLYGYLRPEDYYVDNLQDLYDVEFGKWEVVTTGPDANKMVLYRPDDTVLKKFDLTDAAGNPTFSSPFKRTPE
jgi:hypothetical protein